MKKYNFTINGHDYQVHIKEIEDDIAQLDVNGTDYSVKLNRAVQQASKTPKLVRKPVTKKQGEGDIKNRDTVGKATIKAPLPGTILKIDVSVGDKVKKGDQLMIMEAMKMENQVLSTVSGQIISVKVNNGDTVLQDDTLVEIGEA